jgi:hypothetical protein
MEIAEEITADRVPRFGSERELHWLHTDKPSQPPWHNGSGILGVFSSLILIPVVRAAILAAI